MKTHILVEIKGPPGAGKTVLAQNIMTMLKDAWCYLPTLDEAGQPTDVTYLDVDPRGRRSVLIRPLVSMNETVHVCPLNPDPSVTPATEEEQELCEAAVRAVLATVREARASGKYGPYAWLGESEANQVHHAFEHYWELEKKYGGFTMLQPDEDHLAHLLTRGAILAALLARKAAGEAQA